MEISSYQETFIITQKDVLAFSKISRDKNPIHLDKEVGANSIFKKNIIHGFLGASIFSKIIGMNYPGEGTIYLKQNIKFLAPMFVENNYIGIVTLQEIYPEKGRALLLTQVKDPEGNLIIDGEALVQNPIFLIK